MRYAILLTLFAANAPAADVRQSSACVTPGDTLRYQELTESELTLFTPAGTRLVDQKHQATITLVFGANDGVSAWYDSLALEVESLTGRHLPSTAALLRQPFQLQCDARGRLTTLQSPAIPPEIRELSDLTQAFADFLVRIPRVALEVGVAWTDTLAHVVPEVGGAFRKYTAITTWRVEKDTLFEGERARILTGRSTLTLDAGDPLSGYAGQALSVLAGEEKGRLILARDGRLLSRTKEGTLAGQLTIGSGSNPKSFPQDYTYRSRITHVR